MDEQVKEHPAVQSIRAEGFLSLAIELAIPELREPNAAWFDLAEEGNRLGQRRMNAVEAACDGRSTHDPVSLAARLLIRTQSTLQAVIILAERGLTAEAETLVRGLYENSFWLAYLSAAPAAAVQSIRWDELRSQIGRDKAIIVQLEAATSHDTVLIAKLKRRVTAADAEVRGQPRLGIEALSQKGEFGEFYMFYKMLSSGSAHPSLHSLSRHLQMDEDGSVIGHVVGPDTNGITRALTLAVHAQLACLAAFDAVWPDGDGALEAGRLLELHADLADAARAIEG